MRIGLGSAVTVTASTERWLAAVQAGQAYSFGVNLPASPGNVSEIQLLNPVGSGRTATMRFAVVSCNTVQNFDIRRFDTALATDVGAGINMLLGGAAGVCHVRSAQPAALDGSLLNVFLMAASSPFYLSADWLFILAPGQGVLVAPEGANTQCAATYGWMEQ